MCKVMEDMRNESLQEGMKEGLKKGMQDAARRMLEAGKYELDEIAAVSGLTLDEVKDLQKGMKA